MRPEGDQSPQIQAKPSLTSSFKKPLSFKKRMVFTALSFLLFSTAAILSLEVALRIIHGELLSTKILGLRSFQDAPNFLYDPLLGYVIRPGPFSHGTWDWTVGDDMLRVNGEHPRPVGRPVLAVGNSFVFGNEVQDHEAWPAYLERRLNRPVLNGGVFSYGVDQAVLRAEQLILKHKPSLVILAFISNDIYRSETAFFFMEALF